MRRLTKPAAVLLASGLVAGGLVAGLTTPALADTTSELYCSVKVISTTYSLTATAEYNDSPERGLRYWTSFRFRVDGGRSSENHNNINIKLSEYGSQVFSYKSPDNLQYNRWYTHRPSIPPRTSIYSPYLDALLEVEGIFDRNLSDDPRCTASTVTR